MFPLKFFSFVLAAAGIPADFTKRFEAYEERVNQLAEDLEDMAQKYRRMEAENESLQSFVTHRMLDLWWGVQMNGERTAGTMQNVLMTVSNDHERHMEFVRRQMENRPYLGVPPAANPIRYPAPQFPPPSDPDYPAAELVAAATARPESPSVVEDEAMELIPTEGATHPSFPVGRAPSVLDGPPAECPLAESEVECASEGEDATAADKCHTTADDIDSAADDTAGLDKMDDAAAGNGTEHTAARDAMEDAVADGTAALDSTREGSSALPAAKPAVGRAAPIVRPPSSQTQAQKRPLSSVPEGQEVGTAVKKQKHT